MKIKHFLSQYIKAEAKRLGFDVCGITRAEPVSAKICEGYRKWLADGYEADMDYLKGIVKHQLDKMETISGMGIGASSTGIAIPLAEAFSSPVMSMTEGASIDVSA